MEGEFRLVEIEWVEWAKFSGVKKGLALASGLLATVELINARSEREGVAGVVSSSFNGGERGIGRRMGFIVEVRCDRVGLWAVDGIEVWTREDFVRGFGGVYCTRELHAWELVNGLG